MRKYLYYLSIFLLLTITGCSREVTWDCPLPPPSNLKSESIPLTSITPIVYLDSTLSMQGFVNNRDSYYIQTIQLLDEVIFSLSNNQPQYYSLGVTPQPILEKTATEKATNPNFYLAQEEDALLESALNNHSPNSQEIIIVVTDLLRANLDNSAVITSFKPYLDQGMSIGLIGVRSQFDGKIYDNLLINKGTGTALDFRTDNQENLRPFYILLIGDYQVIVEYFNELNKRNHQLVDSQYFLVINDQIVQNIAHFNITEQYAELKPGLTRVSEIYNQQINLKVNQKELIDLLQISKEGINQQYQYPAIAYYPLPHTPAITIDTQITYCQPTDNQFSNCQTNPQQSQFLQFPTPEITSDKITITLQTRDSNLSNQIEAITLDILPQELQLPQWMREWSYNDSDRNQPTEYLGTRTYKLDNFAQNILTLVNQSLKSNQTNPIARFCFVVHKQ